MCDGELRGRDAVYSRRKVVVLHGFVVPPEANDFEVGIQMETVPGSFYNALVTSTLLQRMACCC